jgi:hypothetical protein
MLLKTIIEVNKIFLLYKEKGQVMETDLPKIHKPDQELMAERQTYTIGEAAKILGICRAVAYRKGVLPTIRIAGRRLVPKRALERMLAETV